VELRDASVDPGGMHALGNTNAPHSAGLLPSVPELGENSGNVSRWRCLVRRLIEVKRKTKQTKQRKIGK
jgi:hypothetical protein